MESSGWKPNVEISPNCPRCGSCNTKFCYYNNYSLTQPRYFCKGCRRYWTRGGSLRNVPVGGGCRKNRRGSKTSFRQSMDALPPKISPNGDKKNPSSCSTSGVSDAPNIDLALVYANFLNQKPDSSVQSTVGLPEDDQLGVIGCLTEPQLISEGNQMYSYGFNSMPKTLEDYGIDQRRCSSSSSSHDPLNFELPPLPGEEAALNDMMWSNSASHSSRPPLFGADAHDADLLMDNWSDFDLSRP